MAVPTARLAAVICVACAGLAACGSQRPAPAASGASTTTPPVSAGPVASSSAPVTTSTPACVGLSICPPPPPDAEGNPACYYADGWRADSSGEGIEAWYFRDPQSPPKPDRVTASVRKKDGATETQDADIGADQQVHRFGFPAVAPSTVQEVLFTSGSGRCFVIGPGG